MTVRPNFFMIGAPKCGTTAMADYLRTHPNVFISQDKEPGYFADDSVLIKYPTLDDYLNLFAGATVEHTIVGEASTPYIYSPTALRKVRAFRSDARLLAMLRNPVDLAHSWHAQLLFSGTESEWDFERSWNLQPKRAMGEEIPKGCERNPPIYLNYRLICSLGSNLERVFETFPRKQVHVILFDDFARNPRSEYLRLLEFLAIPDDGRVEFPRMNQGKQFRSRGLARLPRYVRLKSGPAIQAVKEATGIRHLGIVSAFDRFNAETRPRPPLRPEFRQHLNEVFRDEVLKLESLLGRDLSSWRS